MIPRAFDRKTLHTRRTILALQDQAINP